MTPAKPEANGETKWPFNQSWTISQLDEMRRVGAAIADIYEWDGNFSCDSCDFRSRCDFAFDPFNIEGECLADE